MRPVGNVNTSPVTRTLALLCAVSLGCTSLTNPTAAEPPDLKIAIVGAGPAGLTAARTLARRGYTDVVVFERSDRVGGKAHTWNGINFHYVSPRFELVLGLADELGVPYVPDPQRKYIVGEKGVPQTYDQFLGARYSSEEIAEASENYAAALETFSDIRSSGFANLHPDLTLDFDTFAEKHGFKPIAELVASRMVGFGYAYYENVPAAYFMKIIDVLAEPSPSGVEEPRYVLFPTPEGYEGLWQAVAASLDVRLGSEVTKISRSRESVPEGITVTVNGERQLSFDRVIISAPLSVVPNFLDATAEEVDLFRRLRWNRFFVTLFVAPGLTSKDVWFLDENATPERINHVGSWGDTSLRRTVSKNWSAPVYIAFQLADRDATADEVTQTLMADVSAAGGVASEILAQTEWDYFPHVSGEDLAGGFYDRFEALQGRRGTYYVGSALNFETAEHSSRQARDLIVNHFQDRNP